jgi:hypothetical protein
MVMGGQNKTVARFNVLIDMVGIKKTAKHLFEDNSFPVQDSNKEFT